MDIFAIVLITLTVSTIFGICLFIFICALQPKIIHYYLRRKKARTYYITASKKVNRTDSDLRVNNLDLIVKSSLNNRDKRTYLKTIERSVRTGRRIEDEQDNNHNIKNDSNSNSFYFHRQYINKHLSPTTANIQKSTEI